MISLLVVDDNKDIAEVLRYYFSENFECDVSVAHSALVALHLIKTKVFDVVLTDIAMPGMTGVTFSHKLKEVSQAKLIAVTASFYEGDDFDQLLEKPFSFSEVLTAIENVLGESLTPKEEKDGEF